MIEVSVRRDGFHIAGHAKYAQPGKDIVCAAVSTLTQNLINSILELTDDGEKIKYEISPQGVADIEFSELSDSSKLLVDSFFIGICMIANSYPDNVKIVCG